MSLAAGSKLGPYEILAPLGTGGMGEVYRALDSRLRRNVAMKVLPDAFVSDPSRMARFEREAQLLAALNHPNIAALFGLEESGTTRALVMELVEGPTLAERIGRGPIPVEDAIPLARQLADALEYAHERNIIHRDLKPANVKLPAEGLAKVLDFGLAKAIAEDSAGDDISTSPTLTAAATRAGFILGTAAYMAPEQARGKTVDRRADIWSFGAVLFEMLTGKMAFHGETISDTLAAVIRAEPDWSLLPPDTPQRVRQLLLRCLTKDPRQRLQSIAEARIVLDELAGNSSASSVTAATTSARSSKYPKRERFFWIAALSLLALAFLGFALSRLHPTSTALHSIHLEADAGAGNTLRVGMYSSSLVAFSPAGDRIAFIGVGPDGMDRIYTRALDQKNPVPLAGTERPWDFFFSPDGQWIGFIAGGNLKRISIQGGSANSICPIANARGAAWGEDGNIYVTPLPSSTLFRVPATGGTLTQVPNLQLEGEEYSHRWPTVLPGAKAILFTSNTSAADSSNSNIDVLSFADGKRKTLIHGGSYSEYLPSGHLLYIHNGKLLAVPFDLQSLELRGTPLIVLDDILTTPWLGTAQYSVSQAGHLAYLSGTSHNFEATLQWLDRSGKFSPILTNPKQYWQPSFSPDGQRLAFAVPEDGKWSIWVDDYRKDVLTKLTFSGDINLYPLWTPDGQRIVFTRQESKGKSLVLYSVRADGNDKPEFLYRAKDGPMHQLYPLAWSPDGKWLAYTESIPEKGTLIAVLPVSTDRASGLKAGEPHVFVEGTAGYTNPAFSPDGRWLAFTSNESGHYEVYVRPFPGPGGGVWQVSDAGGSFPRWSTKKSELFYRDADGKIMVVEYDGSGNAFRSAKSQLAVDAPFSSRAAIYTFDLHPDGQRFVVIKDTEAGAPPPVHNIQIILNFAEGLRQLIPVSSQ